MQIHFCAECGFAYDERRGMPSAGVGPGTRWADVPADWRCPGCAAAKSEFRFSATLLGHPPKEAEQASPPCLLQELESDLDATDTKNT